MEQHDFDTLLLLIPGLSAERRSALHDRLVIADKVLAKPRTNAPANPLAETFYAVLANELRSYGHHLPGYHSFQSMPLYHLYLKQIASVRPFFEQIHTPDVRLTKVQRMAMYSQFIKILLEMVPIIPLTPKTLIARLHLLPSAVEQAFPGYFDSGLLSWATVTHAPTPEED